MQAVEAKENLKIGEDSSVQATVPYQLFFRYYNKLAGMTVPVASYCLCMYKSVKAVQCFCGTLCTAYP